MTAKTVDHQVSLADNRIWTFLFSLICFLSLIILVNCFFGIYFETNDDVAMMMIAHGFGIAAVASPTLVFSNVLEGMFVEAIGQPFGFTGYGLYLMGCLVLSLAYIHSAVSRINQRPWITLAVVAAFAIRPIFAPQFTVIAGILAAAAVIAVLVDRIEKSTSNIVVCVIFSTASFCMRAEMFMMLVLLSIPFIIEGTPNNVRRNVYFAVVIFSIFTIFWFANWIFYQSSSWDAFNAMNYDRALFTDYRLEDRVLHDKELIARAGLTPLDINLIANWWFLGISSTKLAKLVSIVGVGSLLTIDAGRFRDWLNLYGNNPQIYGTLLTFIIFIALPVRRMVRPSFSLSILAASSFFIVAIGRGDIVRVVFPCLFLISTVNLLRLVRWRLALIAACLLGVLSAVHFTGRAASLSKLASATEADLAKLDPHPIHVVWGNGLPFEALYRPLERRRDMPRLRLYGLGAAELAPFALAHWGGSEIGLINALASPVGASIFIKAGSVDYISLLRSFCEEKLHGQLDVTDVLSTQSFVHQHVTCWTL